MTHGHDGERKQDERKSLLVIWFSSMTGWLDAWLHKKWPGMDNNRIIKVIAWFLKNHHVVGNPFSHVYGLPGLLSKATWWMLTQPINRPIVTIATVVLLWQNWSFFGFDQPYHNQQRVVRSKPAEIVGDPNAHRPQASQPNPAPNQDRADDWLHNRSPMGSAREAVERWLVDNDATLYENNLFARLISHAAELKYGLPYYLRFALEHENMACKAFPGGPQWRSLSWTPIGPTTETMQFYCVGRDNQLVPAAEPLCNRRDALWPDFWYNTHFQTACMEGRTPQNTPVYAGVKRPNETLVNAGFIMQDPNLIQREENDIIHYLTLDALNAAMLRIAKATNLHDDPCTYVIKQTSRTVEEQLKQFVHDCVVRDDGDTGEDEHNLVCRGNEVKTCRPFGPTFTLEDAEDAFKTENGAVDYLKRKAVLDPDLCPHTSGKAVDIMPHYRMFASPQDDWGPEQWYKKWHSGDECAEALDAAMADAGFCNLTLEPWHYEFPMMSEHCGNPLDEHRFDE